MKNKKAAGLLMIGIFLFQACFLGGCSGEKVNILDRKDEVLTGLNKSNFDKEKLENKGYWAYLDIVLDEAVQIVSDVEECSVDEAEKLIFEKEYSIYTTFDKQVYDAIDKAQKLGENVSFGCAVTDLQGNLLAVYSAGDVEQEYKNFATMKTAPYSSFKPLSVYSPAIESGVATWSTMYEDSPVKQIENEDGSLRDWPANATGTYTEEGVSVYTAIQKSLNTVAVKCLQDYGVEKSITYMKDRFGISLEFEESRLQVLGEEEIIGNVALGYLQDGVSPVDMAGYYQVFANGGMYIAPKTIRKICNADGKTIYERQEETEQVISVQTAFIMNQLLQNVVKPGGTGEKASCDNLLIGGKTGTGDKGNWFVGFTPQYSCAVWHGTEVRTNTTAEIFSRIISQLNHDESVQFPEVRSVQKKVFCKESGKLISDKCQKIDMGYYSLDTELPICDIH